MAKKRKLADLVKEETQRVEKEVETEQLNSNFVTDSESRPAPEVQTNKVKESVTPQMAEAQPTDFETTKLTECPSREAKNSQTLQGSEFAPNKVTESQTSLLPKYQMLARKETRLREEQLDKLTTLSRQLNRQRRGKGERITENTLIRLAIDLLFLREEELIGTTETELQEALGLEVTE